MTSSRCGKLDMLKGLSREWLGLAFLLTAWTAQGSAAAFILWDRPVPWLTYLAVAAGCYIRMRSASIERMVVIENHPNGGA